MFRLIYNLIIWLITLTIFPVWLMQQKFKGKPVLPYLFGFSRKELNSISGRKVLWVQAASVGETMVAARLLQEIKKVFPDQAIVFTGNTMTGQATAERVIGATVDLIGYFPFDHPWIVKRFLTRLKPDYLLLIETEIWPNVLAYSKKRGVKIAIVNGRLNKTYHRLKKYGFYKSALKLIDYIGVQTEMDRERFIQLGAEPSKIEITGNVKFDFVAPAISETEISNFLESLLITKNTPILAAASTHRGEEEVIITAFEAIKKEFPDGFMVLAPRYPDQAEEIVKLLSGSNLKYVRRTEQVKGKKLSEKPDLLLLDTFGELGLAFSIATVAFIGGSLVPIGGHNLLEASIKEKIVLYGPYMHNFQESKELMEKAGTGFIVNNGSELVERFIYFQRNPEIRDSLGKKAKQVILANQGATEKTVGRLKLIFEL
ncbi:MAG: 3-deoxy-D-manno-octulosonic acid transferase [Firmicutes bacterium]|nr:3-deoxy-D-manno-octulosonic acid transferase [Bacillota bacterium]